jgi:flagellar basal-body rod protein FlgG
MSYQRYKSQRTNFQEMSIRQRFAAGYFRNRHADAHHAGHTEEFHHALDWAIQGEGLFAVTLPDGQTGYTRSGQFYLDSENNLVTASGYPLVWDGTIPDNMSDLAISQDGTVTALLTDGSTVTPQSA